MPVLARAGAAPDDSAPVRQRDVSAYDGEDDEEAEDGDDDRNVACLPVGSAEFALGKDQLKRYPQDT
jgi:hypothetical protein